ncbi:MAG: cytochrome c biogenesis protein CcsA [Candidatus Eisenbacteria bacterium]|nr:cytochrome c biogenesis protein CcsA [Candidatus Eisenbacteria bacterium]
MYAVTGLGYGALFVGRTPALGRAARPLLLLSMAAHLVYMVWRSVEVHTLPLSTLSGALTTVSLSLAAVYLYLEIRQHTPMTGVFVVPVVALLVLIGGLPFPGVKPPQELLKLLESPFFAVHMLSAVTAYCAFALAAVYGLLFLMLYHELKLGRLTLVYHRLPPLEQLKQMNIRSTLVGFVLLTAAIAIGAIWLSRLKPTYFADPKVISSFLVWVIFGVAIMAHYRWSQSSRAPVFLTLAGFAMLLLSTLVIGPLSSSFHQFR